MEDQKQKEIKHNVDIYSYLTIKIHSLAEYFLIAKKREDLIWAKKFALQKKIPLLVLGGGSNVVPITKKIKGLVVINRYQKLSIIDKDDSKALISVSSGYPTSLFVSKMIEKGFGGVEYHYGLPGTVGGAVYMNSKWTKPTSYFGDFLISAFLIDNKGEVKQVKKDYFNFAYDFSILQKTKEILLEAVFLLEKTDSLILKKRAEDSLNYRKTTQPYGVFSSGCFFKNLGNQSAGYLIDQAGLKGLAVGDFVVSQKHANFIINRGNGKANDLVELLKIIKKKVNDKFGVYLEEEVELIK